MGPIQEHAVNGGSSWDATRDQYCSSAEFKTIFGAIIPRDGTSPLQQLHENYPDLEPTVPPSFPNCGSCLSPGLKLSSLEVLRFLQGFQMRMRPSVSVGHVSKCWKTWMCNDLTKPYWELLPATMPQSSFVAVLICPWKMLVLTLKQ
jgi:hypothetical protein